MKKIFIILTILSILFISQIAIASDVVYQDFPEQNAEFGTHWVAVNNRLADIKASGYKAVWLPFPVRPVSNTGFYGENPYNYYDLGDTVDNWTKTPLGSKSELIELITNAHSLDLKVYFSVNINHMGKGLIEDNPNAYNGFSYDDFHHYGLLSTETDIWSLENKSVNGYDDLNHESQTVKDYFLTWIKWFVNEVQADCIVFEYAKHIPLTFLKEMTAQAEVPCVADVSLNSWSKVKRYTRNGLDVTV